MEEANRYLSEIYLPAFNTEFSHRAPEEGSAFVPWSGESLDEILCEEYERTVGNDNCVSFEGRILQIPSDRYRLHYVRTTVRVHRHPDGSLSLFHGPRKHSDYPFKKPELPKMKKEPRSKSPSTGIRPVEALV